MKIEKIDHICFAVEDLEKTKKIYEENLGLVPVVEYVAESEFIKVARYYIGDVAVEFMESTSPQGEVAKFIKKRGEGVMLLSFKVPDTVEAMKKLEQAGFQLLDKTPRVWEKSRYAFLNPGFMNGVLVEVID